MNKIKINIIPTDKDLWDGIAGHFTSLSQVLEEMIDNSISNFKANSQLYQHSVFIHFDTLSKHNTDEVVVTIEDTGTGILNLERAFTIGNRSSRETILNEHGFGLKHALASANPSNDSWTIYTRRKEEVDSNKVLVFKAPYNFTDFGYEVLEYNNDNYPTNMGNSHTGTIIRFIITKEFFNTMGKHGSILPASVIAHLHEDLGFVYSYLIKNNEVNIRVQLNDNDKQHIQTILPIIKNTITPGEGSVSLDLGKIGNGKSTGEVKVEYHFIVINKRERTPTGRIKPVYYIESQKSQGVEIRLNGRMIENNILWDIWGVEKHNSHNKFLVIINLVSNNHNSLPTTRSSKNGFRRGDPRLAGLFEWIRKNCINPYETKYDRKESSLIEELKNHYLSMEDRLPGVLEVKTNQIVLNESSEYIEIDLIVKFKNNFIIFETKRNKTRSLDLYQLKLYWDALVIEGAQPTEAVLISVEHGNILDDLTIYNNLLKDGNGKNYNFKLKLWKDENIQYPPLEM